MSYLSKYGTLWGAIPQTPGRVFWVSPSAGYTIDGRAMSASDNNDGLSPDRALLTLGQAITNSTANVGDVIVMLPGAHSYSSTVTVSKSGLTITGLPYGFTTNFNRGSAGPKKHRTSIVNTATAGIIFTISAGVNDTEISFLHFLPVAAGGVCVYAASGSSGAGANTVYIHDCTVAMVATAATSTYGIQLGTAATGSVNDMLIRNCYFQSGDASTTGANGAAVVCVGTAYNLTIENCTFAALGTGAWARAVENIAAAASSGITIRDCDFINSSNGTSVITTAVYTSGTQIDGGINLYRCYIAAGTDVATAAAIVDVGLAETYLASSGGGALANNN